MNAQGWRRPRYFAVLAAVTLLAIVAASFLIFALFVPRPLTEFYYYPFFPFGVLWALLWVFLILGVSRWLFWGWAWRRRGYYSRHYYDPARQILRERYARGEITKEQLDQMTRDLD